MTRLKDGEVGTRGVGRGQDSTLRRLSSVIALTGVLAVSACNSAPSATTPDQPPEDASSTSSAEPTASDGVPAGLEEFYSQEIAWEDCDGGECGRLSVPIDYAEPTDGSIELALLRVPAGNEGQRLGSLLVNPGGPGGSGVEYARLGGLIVSPEVADAYDIVGFDPRGVASSAPITCFDDDQMDEWLGFDPTPDTPEEETEAEALRQEFADDCEAAAPDLLGHVSTVEVARDMDVLRGVLGEPKLDYLGASYGTFIGTTYAQLFPERVDRLVLDGAIDPNLTGLELGLGQAEGFEQATRAYVQDCIDQGDCPLGSDVDAGMTRINDFLNELDEDPLPVSGDTVDELTEGWALLGIIVAMYDETAWGILTNALEQGFNGSGDQLQFLANIYADRNAEGVYTGNGNQAIYAVNCLDRPSEDTDVSDEETLAEFEAVAPTFGRYLAGDSACDTWPVEASETLDTYAAASAAPILVVGTTGDPATPYAWAEQLAQTLDSGVLLTYDGEGHTAYGRGSDCIDNAIDAYLLEGTVPEDGKQC